jgi:hypothetical protein
MKSLIATLRQKWLMWKMEREIYGRVFPHLEKQKDCGYPFQSDEEIQTLILHAKLDAQLHLETIERQADEMGKAYGEAFRFIMYRDLNRRTLAYAKLVQKRVPPRVRIQHYANA